MDPGSREFLLKEYEQVWLMLRHIYRVQDRAMALYLALLAAIAAWVNSLPTDPEKLKPALEGPGRPGAFWFVAFLLFVMLSATLLILLARWWVLSVEYTSALNKIRAAFESNDPALTPFLLLPRRMRDAGSKFRREAQATLYMLMASLAALGSGAGLFRVFRPWMLEWAWVIAIAWGVVWMYGSWWYREAYSKARTARWPRV